MHACLEEIMLAGGALGTDLTSDRRFTSSRRFCNDSGAARARLVWAEVHRGEPLTARPAPADRSQWRHARHLIAAFPCESDHEVGPIGPR